MKELMIQILINKLIIHKFNKRKTLNYRKVLNKIKINKLKKIKFKQMKKIQN